MFYLKPPAETIEYPDNGGLGGAYMERKHSKRLYNHTRCLSGDENKYRYSVLVLGGFAPDAGVYIACVTDDLPAAIEAWEAWSKVAQTMVSIQDRDDDTGVCVEPYGYG